ncbi:uncharacterized protein LOC123525516 isoform X2 [Mercenaria mercenaria]|nr:uncharacterized protein LOC123525516 isoform X2 [Mercenaria mercenaria]XP_045160555.2 uncharacterized protein LOC123525516 isoform X2 [Mercenaria mercenaria]XP_045160556.2 uncharacterized protein LOC123525516 isoform X2 [Mercenaria mercenaria]
MIKSLSVLRIHCTEFRSFYQAAVCCRMITMSSSPGKPPPIGAFVINPLPVSKGNQTDVCLTREKEDVGSVSGNSIVSEKKEIGNVDKFVNDVDKFVDGVDKFVNDVDKLLKISKDDRSRGSTRGTNGDKSMPRSAHDELQDSSMESSVPSSLHNADSLSIGKSHLSGKHISSEGSAGTSDNNSKLMMKLTISGPPKFKFDQKKTVLPPSLLQGVTELVRKEQVNQDNGASVSVTSSEEKSICDESHSSVGARPGVLGFENKTQCYSEESNKEDEKAKEQSVDDKESPFEKQDCIKVPCSDSSDTVSSGYVLSIKSATGLQRSKSANLHQGEIDICGSSKLLAEEDKTNVSTPIEASELAHHACPVEACESNVITDLVETKESNGIKDLVETIKPDYKKETVETNESVCSALPIETNESNNSTHLDGRSHPRDKAQNSDISLNSAVSENIDKMSSSNLLNELEIEHEVNPFSEMDFDDLLDGDFKSPDVSVGFHENKETDFGNSDAEFKICSEELLHIDASVLGKKPAKAGDIVYNLSDLFSGELEQRRKKELRKQKRQAKKLERFLKKKKKSVGADTTDKTDTGDKEEKPRKPVPNYFVAIQITDQKIKSGLKAVQDKVVSENKKLQPALNKLATLHLTMMVLSLKTQEDMERSRQALDKASEKLLSQYTDMLLELEVSGLGNFRNNVVFAKVKHEHQISTLKNVADIVEECFMEQEVISPDQRGFKPHITIMKLSSVKGSKKKGLKKIDEKLYSDFLDTDFGSENISMLQLCAMMKPKDKQGYYQVEHRVQFAKMQDIDTAKPGPDTTGEKLDQHNEVTRLT